MDRDTQDHPDAAPAAGLRQASTVTEALVFTPQYFRLDYRVAGGGITSPHIPAALTTDHHQARSASPSKQSR